MIWTTNHKKNARSDIDGDAICTSGAKPYGDYSRDYRVQQTWRRKSCTNSPNPRAVGRLAAACPASWDPPIEPQGSATMDVGDGPRPPIHSNADPRDVAARWERQGAPIGKGAYGTVWRVVGDSGDGPKEAALKLVNVPALCAGASSGMTAQIKLDIQRELDLAARISQIQGITSMLEAFVEPSGALCPLHETGPNTS